MAYKLAIFYIWFCRVENGWRYAYNPANLSGLSQGHLLAVFNARLRMKIMSQFVVWLAVLLASISPVHGFQEESQPHQNDRPSVAAASSVQDPAVTSPEREKAIRYHNALRKRPVQGFLFDRFYDAWLEDSSAAELEKFLRAEAEQSRAIGDQLLLAFFYSRQGDDVRAIEQFRATLEAHPGSAAGWYEKAVTEARTLDFDTAIADLGKAAAASPEAELAARIAQLRASLLVRNQQIDEAVAAWEALLATRPDDQALLEEIIEQQIAEGLYTQAETKIDQLLALTTDPYQKVMRQIRKGDILQRGGKQPEALAVYGETLRQVGRETWLERELIAQIEQLFRREDDLAGLNGHLATLIAAEPDRIALHRLSVRLLQELGNSDEAIAAQEKIVGLTPGDRVNRETLIALLGEVGQLEKALAQTTSLIEQHPADAELMVRLAGLQHLAGKPDAVVEALSGYVAKSGGKEFATFRAARLLDGFNLPEAARKTHEAGLAAEPDSPVRREAFAQWLHDHDQKPAALEVWKSLAASAERGEVIRIARTLVARRESAAAFELMLARKDEFADDSLFVSQLIDTATNLQKFDETVPWILLRLGSVRSGTDLESVITQALRVLPRLSDPNLLLDPVRTSAANSVPAACLQVELLERGGDQKGADEVLAAALRRIQAAASADSGGDQRREAEEMLLLQQVRLQTVRHDWTAAVNAAKALVELPGGRKSVHLRRLVELCQRDSRLEDALAWVEEWRRVSPGSLQPWLSQTRLLSDLGRPDDALQTLRQAARKFPDDPDLVAMLAERLSYSGRNDEAERLYWRQYEASENVADRLRWIGLLAELADSTGETEQLVRSLEERRKGNPESIEPLLALALVHRIAENYEERRAALLEANRRQPENLDLLLEIARMEENEGEWERALETLENAKRLDNTDRVQRMIAGLCLEYGETERALAILQDVAGGNEADPREVEKIVDSLIAAAEWERARDFLAPHAARLPDDFRLQYLAAVVDEELGDTATASAAFARLLTVEGEIGGLKPNPGGTGFRRANREMLARALPSGFSEVIGILEQMEEAYSHDDEYGYFRGGSNPAGIVSLPESDAHCRGLAFCHLIRLGESMPENERKEILDAVKRSGFPEVDLVIELAEARKGPGMIAPDLTARFPDNDVALASSLLGWMGQETTPEVLLRACERFDSAFPELAFLAAWQLASEDAQYVPLLEKALGRLRTLEQPTGLAFNGFAMREMRGSGEPSAIPAGIENQINQLLVGWYPKLSQSSLAASPEFYFAMMVQLLLEEKDPSLLVRFMEAEFNQIKQQGAGAANRSGPWAGMSRGGGRDGSVVRLLPFPPEVFAALPERITALHHGLAGGDGMPFGFGQEPRQVPSEWLDQFEAAAAVVQDPVLKALLQFQAGFARTAGSETGETSPFAAFQATASAMRESGQPNLDVMLMEASLATHEERWADASSILDQARNLPMTQDLRMIIDGALVAIATQGIADGLDQPAHAVPASAARAAALRLRRNSLQPDQRAELVVVMERLQMNKEAVALEQGMARASTPGTGSFLPSFPGAGSGQPGTATERIEELFNEGRTDAAVRLLVQRFEAMAAAELSDFDGSFQNEEEWNEFERIIRGLKVEKQFLETLSAAEENQARQAGYCGLAQERFGEPVDAIAWYRKAIAAGTRLPLVRLRLVGLHARSDVSQVRAELEAVPEKEMAEFGFATLRMLAVEAFDYGQRLDLIEQLVAFAESRPEARPESLAWLERAMMMVTGPAPLEPDRHTFQRRYMAQNLLENEPEGVAAYVPSLYQRKPDGQPAAAGLSGDGSGDGEEPDEQATEEAGAMRERIAAVQIRRRALHDRICQLMLRTGGSPIEGFICWYALREATGEPIGPEAVELARKALLDKVRPDRDSQPPEFQLYSQIQQRLAGNEMSSDGSVDPMPPLLFLARHFGNSGGESGVTAIAGLAAELRKNGQKQVAELLEKTFALYTVPAEGFLATAREHLESISSKGRNRPPVDPLLVMAVWSDRKLEVDLAELWLDRIADLKKPRSPAAAVLWETLNCYAVALGERGQTDQLRALLEPLRTGVLGTDEEVRARVAGLRKREEFRPVPAGGEDGLQMYGRLLGTLAVRPETVLIALEEAERIGVQEEVTYHVTQMITGMLTDETGDRFLEWLDSTPFLSTVDRFRTFPGLDGRSSALQKVLMRAYSYSANKDKLAQKLEARNRQAFGEKLFLLVLRDRLTRRNILDALGAELPALEALEPARRTELANLVEELTVSGRFREKPDRSTPGPEGQRVAMILQSSRGNDSSQRIARLMEAGDVDEVQDELESPASVAADLEYVIRSQPEQFVPLFVRISSLLRQQIRRDASASGWERVGENPESDLLERLVLDSEGSALLPFLIDLARHPDLPLFLIPAESGSAMLPLLESELEAIRSAGNPSPQGLVGEFRELSRRMATAVGDRDPALLIPAMVELLTRQAAGELALLAEWSAMEQEAAPGSSLARAWAAAVHLAGQRTEGEKPVLRLAAATPEQSHLAGLVGDTTRTLNERWSLGLFLASLDGSLPHRELEICFAMFGEVLRTAPEEGTGWILPALEQLVEIEDDAVFASIAALVAEPLERQFVRGDDRIFRLDSLRSVIRFCHRAGKTSFVNRMLRNASNAEADRGTLGLLVRLGFHRPVAKILELQWSGEKSEAGGFSMSRERGGGDSLAPIDREQLYTPELAAQTSAFLEVFSHPGTKFLAEAWLADFPDPESAGEPTTAKRSDRLQALAGKLAETGFPSETHRETALILLASEPANDAVVGPLLMERARLLRSFNLWASSGNKAKTDHNLRLLATHVAVALRQGDSAPLTALIDLFSEEPEDSRDYGFDLAVGRSQVVVGKAIASSFASWNQEVRDRVMPELRRYSELGTDNAGSYPAIVMLAHALSGHEKEFDAWREGQRRKLPDGMEQRTTGDLDELWPLVRSMAGEYPLASPEQRLGFVRRVWQFGRSASIGVGSGHFQEGVKESCDSCRDLKMGLDAIVEAGFMTADEIAVHGPSLAEINPVDGEIWRQVAFEQLAREQLEAAALSFGKAVELTPGKLVQARSNRKVEYAWILNRLGRTEEARAALKDVESELLLAKNPGRYRELEQALRQ